MELWSSSPPYSVSDTQTAFRRFIGGYVSSVQPSPGLFSSMRILPRFQIVSRQLEGIIPTSAAAQRSRGAFRLRLIAGRRILPSAVSLLEVVAPEASPNRASKVSSAFLLRATFPVMLSPLRGAVMCLLLLAAYIVFVVGMGFYGWWTREDAITKRWEQIKAKAVDDSGSGCK